MKTIKFIIPLSVLLIISSCKTDNKSKTSQEKKVQIEEKSVEKKNKLILTEKTFGEFNLKKGMTLEESEIKKAFSDFEVSKNIGEQDGPNYFYYKIGTEAILTTPNTESDTLSQVFINEQSKVIDEYGIKLGMKYSDIEKKRPNMNISTEHYHIYLYKEGSNIAYEISLENYNGPDKDEYTLDDIKNYSAKVVSLIWNNRNPAFKNTFSDYNSIYKNEKGENIGVTYFGENDKMYVKLKLLGENELTLEQTTAWAKGAKYGKKTTQWHAQGNKGILINNGIKTKYQKKNKTRHNKELR